MHANITFKDVELCDQINSGINNDNLILKRKIYILQKHIEDVTAHLDNNTRGNESTEF